MNTDAFYDRRSDRVLPEQPAPQQGTDEAVSGLAVHRDPSVPPMTTPAPTTGRPGIAWVRASELPTLVGAQWANRSVDLQSEAVRRSRRAPLTAAQTGRRISRSLIARPEPASPTATRTEELRL